MIGRRRVVIHFIKTYPLGDSAIVVQLGETIDLETHRKVRALSDYLERNPFPGMREYIPAFTTVTITYDGLKVGQVFHAKLLKKSCSTYETVRDLLVEIIEPLEVNNSHTPKTIEIPVCYGNKQGPDLEEVASYNGLTSQEVIDTHANGNYLVYMLGFAPGFPYLGGLSQSIACPRKDSPRSSIPAGSVGIAGGQTGVYPIETPGGWQLIGRTPLKLFRPDEQCPTLLQPGNFIKFYPISQEQYEEWGEE